MWMSVGPTDDAARRSDRGRSLEAGQIGGAELRPVAAVEGDQETQREVERLIAVMHDRRRRQELAIVEKMRSDRFLDEDGIAPHQLAQAGIDVVADEQRAEDAADRWVEAVEHEALAAQVLLDVGEQRLVAIEGQELDLRLDDQD